MRGAADELEEKVAGVAGRGEGVPVCSHVGALSLVLMGDGRMYTGHLQRRRKRRARRCAACMHVTAETYRCVPEGVEVGGGVGHGAVVGLPAVGGQEQEVRESACLR